MSSQCDAFLWPINFYHHEGTKVTKKKALTPRNTY